MENPVKHKRLTEALEDYWNMQKGDAPMPDESTINPDDLGELWDSCFLLQVRGKGDFRYLYMGPALIDAYGDDMTDLEVSERLMGEVAHPLLRKFEKVVELQAPYLDEDVFTNRNNMEIRYRSILLPLTRQTDDVAYILGGMRWKAY